MKKLSLGENYTRKCASEDIILTNGGFKHLKQGTYQSSQVVDIYHYWGK